MERFPDEVAAALGLLVEPDLERARRMLASAGAWDGAGLPAPFRRLVWPLLRLTPDDSTARVLGDLRRLDASESPTLMAAIGWWLARGPIPAALPWLHAALALPAGLAEVVLFLCAEMGARDVPVSAIPLGAVAEAAGLDRAGFASELWALLDGHRRGVDPHLLLPGLELVRCSRRLRLVRGARPAEMVTAAAVRDVCLVHEGEWWREMGPDLWRAISRFPGLADAVLAQPWAEVDGSAAEVLVREIAFGWPDPSMGGWWVEFLPRMVAVVRCRPHARTP